MYLGTTLSDVFSRFLTYSISIIHFDLIVVTPRPPQRGVEPQRVFDRHGRTEVGVVPYIRGHLAQRRRRHRLPVDHYVAG